MCGMWVRGCAASLILRYVIDTAGAAQAPGSQLWGRGDERLSAHSGTAAVPECLLRARACFCTVRLDLDTCEQLAPRRGNAGNGPGAVPDRWVFLDRSPCLPLAALPFLQHATWPAKSVEYNFDRMGFQLRVAGAASPLSRLPRCVVVTWLGRRVPSYGLRLLRFPCNGWSHLWLKVSLDGVLPSYECGGP